MPDSGSIEPSPLERRLRLKLAEWLAVVAHLRLPAPSILPATGALVGFYAGLAAGLFTALISSIQLLGFGLPRVLKTLSEPGRHPVRDALARAPWHPEYLVAGALVAAALLSLARLVPSGGTGSDAIERTETRRRGARLRAPRHPRRSDGRLLGQGMDYTDALCRGKLNNRVSAWLASQTDTARCVLGGVVVGLIGIAVPAVMGSGAESLSMATSGELAWHVLVAAAALKIVATSVTLGSGASGGTFFPALFIGGMSGGAFGALLEHLFPGATGGPGSYALVGMAACVAGFTRAPLTAIVIVFELTNDYTAILPLMVACTSAGALCQAVLGHAHGPSSLTAAIPDRPVREFMATTDPLVPERASYDELREALLRSTYGLVVLVDGAGKLAGLALLHDIQSQPAGRVHSRRGARARSGAPAAHARGRRRLAERAREPRRLGASCGACGVPR